MSPLRIRFVQGQAPRRRRRVGAGAARGVPHVRGDLLAEDRQVRARVQGDRPRGFREHLGEDRHDRERIEGRTRLRRDERGGNREGILP